MAVLLVSLVLPDSPVMSLMPLPTSSTPSSTSSTRLSSTPPVVSEPEVLLLLSLFPAAVVDVAADEEDWLEPVVDWEPELLLPQAVTDKTITNSNIAKIAGRCV